MNMNYVILQSDSMIYESPIFSPRINNVLYCVYFFLLLQNLPSLPSTGDVTALRESTIDRLVALWFYSKPAAGDF